MVVTLSMWPSYRRAERQLSNAAVNRQLPIGRVDGIDGMLQMQVDEVDAKVDGEGTERTPNCVTAVKSWSNRG